MSDENQRPKPPFPIVENPAAPEIHVDGYWGSTVTAGGVIKLNLVSQFIDDSDGSIKGRVVARLAIASPQLQHVHVALGNLLDQYRKNGWIK